MLPLVRRATPWMKWPEEVYRAPMINFFPIVEPVMRMDCSERERSPLYAQTECNLLDTYEKVPA
ncbi:hypothetical protein MA16_Dca010765 [Dendrobium catenatum]|uniref:Uncharacterized protein n=1 Tax=Dendrobium catenatum TaxID=906689 RepID=A0A2I0VKB1_9ASPA|nr:hypothetical protein MA16_Dca010765 [Dendrobium catenatum]